MNEVNETNPATPEEKPKEQPVSKLKYKGHDVDDLLLPKGFVIPIDIDVPDGVLKAKGGNIVAYVFAIQNTRKLTGGK